jgi:putative N6-adenine-specific DNA methylase
MPHAEPLVDPFAGSGTIPVEAALLARGFAVRKPDELRALRMTPFADFPDQSPPLYPDTRPQILASDIDEECVAWMIGNLRSSGLTGKEASQSIVVNTMDATEITPQRVAQLLPGAATDCGLIACNPPYGRRMQGADGDVLPLYRNLARALKRIDGWRAAVIIANEEFKLAFNARPSMVKPTSAAGLRAEFLIYQLGENSGGGRRRTT